MRKTMTGSELFRKRGVFKIKLAGIDFKIVLCIEYSDTESRRSSAVTSSAMF